MRIVYKNLADLATLTADPVASTVDPVTYLQQDSRGHLFAAAASGSQVIKGTWNGTAYTVSAVRLERTNLADGDTWRVQLYSGADWTTEVYDSTAVAPFATNLYDDWNHSNADLFFTAETGVKSFKITLSTATAFQAARLVLGAYTEAEFNPMYGITLGYDGNSEQTRREGGSMATTTRADWRALSFDMLTTTEAYRAAWNEIGRYAGNHKTVWVSVFPGTGGTQERDFSIVGKFDQAPQIRWGDVTRYDFSLTLNEL